MSGNSGSGEKTEKATPKRLKDLRKKGQIAKSKEIVSAAVLLGLFVVVWLGFDTFLDHFKTLIRLPVIHLQEPFREALPKVLLGAFIEILYLSAPFVLGAIVFAILSNMLQFGVLFSLEPIKPDLKKINPIEGFKKIFTLSNLIELVKSVLKITALGVVIYYVLKGALDALVRIPYIGIQGVWGALGMILLKIVSLSALVFIAVAIIDAFFQKFYFLKKNRMTKDEVKREHKEMEGDPLLKRERKKLHREMASSDVIENTKKSTVIVSNPTHFAVGVYYNADETPLPVITIKGVDRLALFIIKTAHSVDVPVAQNADLARRLYKDGEIDQFVPSDLLRSIASVLQWVERKKMANEQLL